MSCERICAYESRLMNSLMSTESFLEQRLLAKLEVSSSDCCQHSSVLWS